MFSICNVFFVSKGNRLDFYFTLLKLVLVPCGGRTMSLRTSALCRLYFHILLDHWAHCGIFENGVLLMYTLEGVSSVANFITANIKFQ